MLIKINEDQQTSLAQLVQAKIDALDNEAAAIKRSGGEYRAIQEEAQGWRSLLEVVCFEANLSEEERDVEAEELSDTKFNALAKILEAEKFMGIEHLRHGAFCLLDVPGMPKHCYLYATPWFNGEDTLDFNLENCNGENAGETEEVLNSVPFPSVEASTEEHVAAYKRILTEKREAIIKIAQASPCTTCLECGFTLNSEGKCDDCTNPDGAAGRA